MDVTLREDTARFTIGNGEKVLAYINNLSLHRFIKLAFKVLHKQSFFAAHLSLAFALLVTPFS